MNETESGEEYRYNRVPYQSHAVTYTHPDHMAALGRLFGMQPADIQKCRVLELGCGDGGNLIPMAFCLPESEFAGFDLSDQAIARGSMLAAQLGLRNLKMFSRDILDIGEDIGKFDYIIAHGVYSWVPENVREKMLQIFRTCLSEQGIVYVSYNAYPGGYLNRIANDAMLFHTASVSSPEQKNIQALAILQFLARASAESGGVYSEVLKDQMEHLSKVRPVILSNYLFHDRIAEINQPFYFSEFMAGAHRHGLRFLAEADFSEMQDFFLKPEIAETLRRLAGNSILAKEQLLDFIKGRKFRKTLLCHEHITLNRQMHPELMKNFLFSGRICCMDAEENTVEKERDPAELIRMPGLRFRTEGEKAVLVTDELLPRLALVHLSRISQRMGFDEIVTLGQKYGIETTDREISALCEVLQTAFSVNMLRIHVWKPQFVTEPSSFPIAGELARHQIAQNQRRVSNLLHQTIELENTYGYVLLPLMDGSRDIDSIRQESLKIIRKQGIGLKGKSPDEKSDELIYAEIDEEIANCARYGLLIA